MSNWCSDCKAFADVVEDHAAGDMICKSCGLVLESHGIDETSEWRTFANESNGNDPVRVGGPVNELLSDKGLSTIIERGGKEFEGSNLSRWQNRGANPDRNLINAFRSIAAMADRLGLVSTIKDRANEIYKQIEDLKSIRGRSQDAILAACVYIACRQEDKPRTFKEICAVASNASKKEIGRCYKFIVDQLEKKMGTIHASDYLRRFCSHLGLDHKKMKLAQEIVSRFNDLPEKKGRSPISVAAASIYVVSLLTDEKKPLKDISRVAGVSEVTLKGTYKDMYPHMAKILPEGLAIDANFQKLPQPLERGSAFA